MGEKYFVAVFFSFFGKTYRNCIVVDSEELALQIVSLFTGAPGYEAFYRKVNSPCTKHGNIKE